MKKEDQMSYLLKKKKCCLLWIGKGFGGWDKIWFVSLF